MKYDDIIGHDKIIQNLKDIIINDKVVHAYLFRGAKSLGKSSIANIFAKTLLCEKKGSSPCNKCSACIKFDHGNHPDFSIIKSEGKYIKKGQIDEIQNSINLFPYEGDKKVYIIKDANNMTVEAQNSFLKTLEEPPNHAIIIMTCVNSYNLLPTIVSRTQIFTFFPVETTKIKEALINKCEVKEEEAEFITSFSNGIVGMALKEYRTQKFKDLRNKIISIVTNLIKDVDCNIFEVTEFFIENKDDLDQILDILLIWLRDLLIIKLTNVHNKYIIINKDKYDILISQAEKITKNKLTDIVDIVEEAKYNIKANANSKLNLDVMLLRLQEVLLYGKCSRC
ncbi:DNA polymerase III subunit delta' [Abyssisolibacter fermentans]|uniref:DNA polymerase III subunit delta' n=1 Tax=Abyssisolibacter fermentans TaxID=1766203 RepID=UPI00082B6CC1|nr:DNA polymerase III subunit delta' [Abyssisolibacter fermentans]